jgi:peptidoglycan/xylan/chitin deacetylase (PgdA/CDA1 family)
MLCELLRALEKQTERDFEAIVVCDGQDPETRQASATFAVSYPVRWVFHTENLGLAAARNTGADSASGEYLLFLDDDVEPVPGLIAAHMAARAGAEAWPPLAVCGRIVEVRKEPFRSRTDEFMQAAWEQSLEAAMPSSGSPPLSSIGADAERAAWFGLNCSIKKELFDRLGRFNPVMRSDEEMEFGLRLYRNGVLTHYAPDAIVRHRGSKDMSAYYPRCWRLSGSLDVHRALDRGERSAQISQLSAAGMFSSAPNIALGLARAAQQVTDITGSRLAFGAWARLRHVGEYWSGVGESGADPSALRKLAGPSRPILMLHSLSVPQSERETTYYLSPRRFRRFLSWIKMRGYTHVSPAGWLRDEIPQRNVLLTFDDAYDDLYRELPSLLTEFKLKPLVFVAAERIGATNDWDVQQGLRQRNLLTLDQMRELQRAGVVFGSHSGTHPLLTQLSTPKLLREVRDSKARLEDLLGTSVDWFAFPYGDADRRVRAAVLEAGYKAAVTTDAGLNQWQDPLALCRLEVDDRDWLLDFAIKIASGRNPRRSLQVRLNIGR